MKMTRTESASGRFFVAMAVLTMCVGASASIPAADPDALTAPQIETALRNFDRWIERNTSSAGGSVATLRFPVQSPAAAAEGLLLAVERRRAMLQLGRSNPREALARALRPAMIEQLPAAIREQAESYVDACEAQYAVRIESDFRGNVPVSSVERTVTIGRRTYEAAVFGRRLGTPSKAIHANGIAFGDTLILEETPLRRMDAQEAADDPAVRSQCGVPGTGCIAAKIGAQTLIFRSEAQLRAHQEALAQEEATLGLHRAASREEVPAPIRESDTLATLQSAWTTGEKTLLYLRASFQDYRSDPLSTASAQSTMNTVANYFRETSYGRTTLRTTIPPTFMLSRNRADYTQQQIIDDVLIAARAAGYDRTTYDRFVIAWRPSSTGRAWAFIGAPGVYLPGSFSADTTAHELGHTYGLYHANSWRADSGSIGPGRAWEYGNPFDAMGENKRGHFNAAFKAQLDWLLPSEYTTASTTGVYRIEPIDDPTRLGKRALKIRKDHRSYWIEFRNGFPAQPWAMNGAILLWDTDNEATQYDNLILDMTPDSSSSFDDEPLLVGRTFSDLESNIHVTPYGRGAAAMDIIVAFGPFPGNRAPTLTLGASATRTRIDTPVSLSATASDPDGDVLAYSWEFGDGTFGRNLAALSKSWPTSGVKQVRCIVTDMKGGTASATISITVDPAYTLSGTVRLNGSGLSGVTLGNGVRSTTSLANGTYSLTIPSGTHTITPSKAGYTFTPTSRSVTVGAANVTGIDFAASAQ